MKKQKQVTITPKEMTEMARAHKAKSVAPPPEANRGMDGKYSVSKAQAAQFWFMAAKEQDPSGGFLGVPSQKIEEKSATDREMLHKSKKSKE